MDQTVVKLFTTQNPNNVLNPPANNILHEPHGDSDLARSHYGPENAVAVTDYPYGSLRCIMRYWLEYKIGKGTRLVSQTNNPKRPGLVWNKPHASTYSDGIVCLYTDEKGHVQRADFTDSNLWTITPQTLDDLQAFETRYGVAFTESDLAYMAKFREYVSRRLVEFATPHAKTSPNQVCRVCKNYSDSCTGETATTPTRVDMSHLFTEKSALSGVTSYRYVNLIDNNYVKATRDDALCIGEYLTDNEGLPQHVRDWELNEFLASHGTATFIEEADLVSNVMGALNLSDDQWDALSLEQQQLHIDEYQSSVANDAPDLSGVGESDTALHAR